jgi:hypothetical protein
MRAFPLLISGIIGAALCTSAVAQDREQDRGQDRDHLGAPPSPAPPAATTGAAPRAPANQAPVGHRQPMATDAPSQDTERPLVSPYNQKIDRDLNICRGC